MFDPARPNEFAFVLQLAYGGAAGVLFTDMSVDDYVPDRDVAYRAGYVLLRRRHLSIMSQPCRPVFTHASHRRPSDMAAESGATDRGSVPSCRSPTAARA